MTAGRLEIRGLSVTIGGARLLRDVDLEVEPGTWTGVVGPNGAGKSTLLRAVAGLVPYAGQVRIDGRDVARMAPRERAGLIGYAPQVPVLPDAITVREYVELGRTPYRSLLAGPRHEDRLVVAEAMDRLDLDRLAARSLCTLSGGERQRAVLARALAQRPRLLLLDEPTTALDLGHAQQLLDLVDRLRADDGLTVVSTLHDLTLAGQYPQALVLLAAGGVAASGTPAQVLTPDTLRANYGARADVVAGPDGAWLAAADGVWVLPVRHRVEDLPVPDLVAPPPRERTGPDRGGSR